jgi:hypothetical protein
MQDYDFYLRHASVRDGAWVGFLLAWRDLVGLPGLTRRPHLHWRPWILDPAFPDDPAQGAWGVRQWRFDVALLDGVAGLAWTPPADERTSADMRADLLGYADLPAIELKDVDSATYVARIVAFSEQCVEPYTAPHTNGGWLATVVFAETAA